MASTADRILKAGGLSAAQIQQVHNGELVKDVVSSHHDRELGVKLAGTIQASVDDLKMSFLTKLAAKNADPSTTGLDFIDEKKPDFSGVTLDPAMIKAYLNAKPGSDLNLSKSEIATFQSVKKKGGSSQDVQKAFHTILLERYQSYREMGLSGILPYARSSSKDYFPGDDLQQSVELSNVLKEQFPAFHEVLSMYPSSRPENLDECFFWINSSIDNKSTVSLVHHLGMSHGTDYIFAERQFYVSRSHNSVQGVGGAFPDNNDRSIFVYCTRTSTDQVSGFGGSTKKAIGARIMSSRVADNFEQARRKVGSS